MPLLLEIVVCHRGHLCSAYFPLFDAVPVTGANVRRKTSSSGLWTKLRTEVDVRHTLASVALTGNFLNPSELQLNTALEKLSIALKIESIKTPITVAQF